MLIFRGVGKYFGPENFFEGSEEIFGDRENKFGRAGEIFGGFEIF